ncbi:MAG TPA: aldehyde dehydrogenase family protein, partial [Tissierellia bacterium]|nr:aldehyde dehydrogenase family protein [Tissierellia bacterium]
LTKQILPDVLEATESDYATEFADLILAIKVVEDLDEAIEHIAAFGTGHSDAILTKNNKKADIFKKEVDSSVVYVNASTRFTDGGEFGFGGEIGISTQKLHARGPMGLEELTSSKYVLEGDGHIRS